jgi:hypothetical protein
LLLLLLLPTCFLLAAVFLCFVVLFVKRLLKSMGGVVDFANEAIPPFEEFGKAANDARN